VLIVYDDDLAIELLAFQNTSVSPTQVDFSFVWGSVLLQCGVEGTVAATIEVEFEDIQPILLEGATEVRLPV